MHIYGVEKCENTRENASVLPFLYSYIFIMKLYYKGNSLSEKWTEFLNILTCGLSFLCFNEF